MFIWQMRTFLIQNSTKLSASLTAWTNYTAEYSYYSDYLLLTVVFAFCDVQSCSVYVNILPIVFKEIVQIVSALQDKMI